MAKFLQLTLWNVNGLTQHIEQLKTFISIHNIDVMLISETHFTEKSYLKLPNYTVYHTNHPAGTATIIKNSIKHHQLNNYSQDFLQVTSVWVEDSVCLITILVVYLPPKHTAKQEQLEDFYNNL
jgi:exonuclease III